MHISNTLGIANVLPTIWNPIENIFYNKNIPNIKYKGNFLVYAATSVFLVTI